MPSVITEQRVFIASPSGLEVVRTAFRDQIKEYNRNEASHRGVRFTAVGWEDTPGGATRPQSQINADLRSCDLFVLVFWDRWGSPPSVDGSYTSACEEEFAIARTCMKDKSMRDILLFFKGVEPRQLADPGPQLEKILSFKKEIEEGKEFFPETFDSLRDFRSRLRNHLGRWLRTVEGGEAQRAIVSEPLDRIRRMVSGKDKEAESREREDAWEQAARGDFGRLRKFLSTIHYDADKDIAWRLASEGKSTMAEELFSKELRGHADMNHLIRYGDFLKASGRLERAHKVYGRAKLAAEKVMRLTEFRKADILSKSGDVQEERGRLEDAERYYLEARDIYEEIGQLENLAEQCIKLASIYQSKDEVSKAEEMIREALEIKEMVSGTRSA